MSHKRPCFVWFHFYESSRIGKPVEAESGLVVGRAVGNGRFGGESLKVWCFWSVVMKMF